MVIAENLQRSYGMKLQPSQDKLVTADDSELDCRGFVNLTLDDIPTKALVTDSLTEELIGWLDMIHLGIISPNFPARQHEQINTMHFQDIQSKVESIRSLNVLAKSYVWETWI